MKNKLIFKGVIIATFIFGVLLFVIQEFLVCESDVLSAIILDIILSPVGFLGFHSPKLNAYLFYLLGLNTMIYAIIFAFLAYSAAIILSDLRNWRKDK